jgi:hypothetical protein
MKLEEYLDSKGIKKTFFASQLGLTYRTLFTIMKSNECRKTIALAIENITKGEVTMKDFQIR